MNIQSKVEAPAIEVPTFPEWQHEVHRNYVGRGGTKLVVHAGLHYIEGNHRPYFSVTADVWYSHKNRLGHRYYRREPDCCGCCHEEILNLVPAGDRPMWKALIALHLSDDLGIPMYAEANGCYHLGVGQWSVTHGKDGKAPDALVVASHFRISESEAGLILTMVAGVKGEAAKKRYVRKLCLSWSPRWATEAAAGIEALKRLGSRS